MDDSGEAETFLNKATNCVNAITAATNKRAAGVSASTASGNGATTGLSTALQMRYRLTAARVLDGARRYLEAAGRYLELISLVVSLDESEVRIK